MHSLDATELDVNEEEKPFGLDIFIAQYCARYTTPVRLKSNCKFHRLFVYYVYLFSYDQSSVTI